MLKKYIRILATLVLFVFCFVAVSVDTYALNDVSATENGAAELFEAITDEPLDIDGDYVSRGQFVKYILSVFNIESVSTENYVFSDVNEANEYKDYIYTALKLGFVSESSLFRVNEAITYPEAVKIAVCALGYTDVCMAKGGYPYGYTVVASQLNLDGGIDEAISQNKFDKSNFARFLANILHAKVSRRVVFGGISSYNTEQTVLEYVYDIKTLDGVVTSAIGASLFGTSANRRENVITVDGKTFYYDNASLDMLARDYRIYYRESEDSDKCFIVYAEPRDNTESVFNDRDFVRQSGLKLIFENEYGKEEKFTLENSYYLIYNGRKVTDKDNLKKYLSELNGTVTLLDNDGDGLTEAVFLFDYSYITVAYIDSENMVVADAHSAENTVDFSDMDYTIYDFSTGSFTDFSSLTEGSVIEIAVSKGKDFATVNICPKVVCGNFTAFSDDELKIDDEYYYLSDYFKKYYKSSAAELKNYEDGVFYIDSRNNIVSYIPNEYGMEYGYLLDAAIESAGLQKTVKFKLLSDDSEIIYPQLAEKITFDGARKKSKEIDFSSYKNQVIRYKMYGDTVVCVDTASDLTTFDEKKGATDDSLTKFPIADSVKYMYRQTPQMLGSLVCLRKAVVFRLNTTGDEDKYQAGSANTIMRNSLNYNTSDHKIAVYDVDEYGMAGAVVVTEDVINLGMESFVVGKVARTFDREGNECTMLGGIENGAYKTYYLPDDVSIDKSSGKAVGFGDVLRVVANSNDKVIYAVVDFEAGEYDFNPEDTSLFNLANPTGVDTLYYSGKVYSINDSVVRLSDTKTDGKYVFNLNTLLTHSVNTTNIVLCDLESKEFQVGNLKQIKPAANFGQDASYVLIASNYGTPKLVVIYR